MDNNEFDTGAFPKEPPEPLTKPALYSEALQPASISLGVSVMMILALSAQMVCVLIVQLFAPHLLQAAGFTAIASSLTMYAVAFPISIPFFRIGKATPPEKKHLSILAWLGALAVCFALMLAGNTIGNLFNQLIGRITGSVPQNDLNGLIENTPAWATLVFVGICAPIVEELVYRKLVIDRLRRYGDLFAVLASGILFGLIHANFYQFFYATFIGLVFGCVYIHTGRIAYTVTLHVAFNLIGGVYTPVMARLLENLDFTQPTAELISQNPAGIAMMLLYYAFLFVCVVATPIVIIRAYKHIRFQKPLVLLSKRDMTRVWLCNPAVWALLVVIVFLFAV